MADFTHVFARRTRLRGGDELTAILAGSPPGVLSMTGGFPNPGTFPTDKIDDETELETAVERLAAVVRGQRGLGVDSIDSEATRA
jgi:hypothetical protein